ncbi:hypothetical protein Moror_10081 [Moniliophthora roreri MCA 2997]|uniref:Uncharacterized protein n=1 Tax=Moniliophthora roreri (strain MCA 2997) TaxID=1381753 RepID=V2Y1K7_MONRO|nr:hypothetical protein Moror_10081 [Moniliophthora roreri MCA 2997]KAI3602376.1 hypothetical protein WG66_011305 [Moniliophthora roreri]
MHQHSQRCPKPQDTRFLCRDRYGLETHAQITLTIKVFCRLLPFGSHALSLRVDGIGLATALESSSSTRGK